MNGVIHPACHGDNMVTPETEEEMYIKIFEYIDMLLEMVKPSKLVYMAIDGVAPRAKMNQQRSRRFRAVKDSVDKKEAIRMVKEELRLKGIEFDDEEEKPHFDSNVITPGTPFMCNLAKALREWIDSKMANVADTYIRDDIKCELRWPKDLVVILSDASVPGEGEHKIMDYVRKQKAQPDYNPNLRHCLCGADADLIMLGLGTHELDFTILREEFVPNQPKPCDICGQFNHETKDCQGKANIPDQSIRNSSQPFIYIRLCVLREYLEKECDDLDFERYIDDWVLLFFFVGNDFLPHLPSLEIREGAVDKLLRIYKKLMSQYSHPKPYITDNGYVSLHKVEMIMKEFGNLENDIFVRRKINEEKWRARQKTQKMLDHKAMKAEWLAPVPVVKRGEEPEKLSNVKKEAVNLSKESLSKTGGPDEKSDDDAPKQVKRKVDDAAEEDEAIEKELAANDNEDSDEDTGDDVQLWNEGWKERYYLHKFGSTNHSVVSQKIVENYAVGLCWVMRYYYQGCPDWQWYYPYHYAPFASDFKSIAKIKVNFNREAKPFRPLEQLMSVFPAASGGSLPKPWRDLMEDKNSQIYDFYPTNFKVDLNGKKQAWQGVSLLPFIDEDRLFRTLKKVYPQLTAAEVERNQLGEDLVFVSKVNSEWYDKLTNALKDHPDEKFDCKTISIHGINGKMRKSKSYTDEIANAFCLEYFDPEYEKSFVFPAQRLTNAKLPERVLKPEDFQNNRFNNNRNNYQNNYQNSHQNNHGNQQNRGYNQNNSNSQYYRPMIGFTRNDPQASLSNAGHRIVEHHSRQNYSNSGNLNNRPANSGGFQSNRSNNYQPNYQSGRQTNNYQQANNYQTNNNQSNFQQPAFPTNYQPVAYQPVDYQALNYQQQTYQQALSFQQQALYQLNYQQSQPVAPTANLNANYLRRDSLNPSAQEYIPSYSQSISNAQPLDQGFGRNNFNSRGGQNNRQNRN